MSQESIRHPYIATQGENLCQTPQHFIIRAETPRILQGKTNNIKVNKMSKKDGSEAWVRGNNPTTGVICSSSRNKRNPNVFLFTPRKVSEDWTEYLAEEARVKASKLRKENYNT